MFDFKFSFTPDTAILAQFVPVDLQNAIDATVSVSYTFYGKNRPATFEYPAEYAECEYSFDTLELDGVIVEDEIAEKLFDAGLLSDFHDEIEVLCFEDSESYNWEI